jgi:hypothetical protein
MRVCVCDEQAAAIVSETGDACGREVRATITIAAQTLGQHALRDVAGGRSIEFILCFHCAHTSPSSYRRIPSADPQQIHSLLFSVVQRHTGSQV